MTFVGLTNFSLFWTLVLDFSFYLNLVSYVWPIIILLRRIPCFNLIDKISNTQVNSHELEYFRTIPTRLLINAYINNALKKFNFWTVKSGIFKRKKNIPPIMPLFSHEHNGYTQTDEATMASKEFSFSKSLCVCFNGP